MHGKVRVASNHVCSWHVGIFIWDNLMIAPHVDHCRYCKSEGSGEGNEGN